MSELIPAGDDESQCTGCDMVFQVIWNRNPLYDQIEYCPFCGEEIEVSDE